MSLRRNGGAWAEQSVEAETFTESVDMKWNVIILIVGTSEKEWDAIEQAAEGGTVNLYMWGGEARANAWFDGYVSEILKKRYDIELRLRAKSSMGVTRILCEPLRCKGVFFPIITFSP